MSEENFSWRVPSATSSVLSSSNSVTQTKTESTSSSSGFLVTESVPFLADRQHALFKDMIETIREQEEEINHLIDLLDDKEEIILDCLESCSVYLHENDEYMDDQDYDFIEELSEKLQKLLQVINDH